MYPLLSLTSQPNTWRESLRRSSRTKMIGGFLGDLDQTIVHSDRYHDNCG